MIRPGPPNEYTTSYCDTCGVEAPSVNHMPGWRNGGMWFPGEPDPPRCIGKLYEVTYRRVEHV